MEVKVSDSLGYGRGTPDSPQIGGYLNHGEEDEISLIGVKSIKHLEQRNFLILLRLASLYKKYYKMISSERRNYHSGFRASEPDPSQVVDLQVFLTDVSSSSSRPSSSCQPVTVQSNVRFHKKINQEIKVKLIVKQI